MEYLFEMLLAFGGGIAWAAAFAVVEYVANKASPDDDEDDDQAVRIEILQRATIKAFRSVDKEIRRLKKRVKAAEKKLEEYE